MKPSKLFFQYLETVNIAGGKMCLLEYNVFFVVLDSFYF